MHHHVTSLYAAWLDQTPEERRAVDEHLRNCSACAEYYRKMSLLLDDAGRRRERLTADPFLPARIAARAAGPAAPRRAARAVLGWSAAGALALVAIAIGISLGKDLAPSASSSTTSYTSSDIVSAYYSAVSQQNFSTRLESVVETTPKGTP